MGHSRMIEKLEESNRMMEESIRLVETRITQVEDKLLEFKKQEAANKAAIKVEDPKVIGKITTLIFSKSITRR
jgi:phage shock protein A